MKIRVLSLVFLMTNITASESSSRWKNFENRITLTASDLEDYTIALQGACESGDHIAQQRLEGKIASKKEQLRVFFEDQIRNEANSSLSKDLFKKPLEERRDAFFTLCLRFACYKKSSEIVELLLAAGATGSGEASQRESVLEFHQGEEKELEKCGCEKHRRDVERYYAIKNMLLGKQKPYDQVAWDYEPKSTCDYIKESLKEELSLKDIEKSYGKEFADRVAEGKKRLKSSAGQRFFAFIGNKQVNF